jgi:membrane-associated protease RseP (regulator of RpoE activity)
MSSNTSDRAVTRGLLLLVFLPIAVVELVVTPHLHPHRLPTPGLWVHAEIQAVLALVALITTVWVHELGHAGAARLCQRRVIRIRIGCGPVVANVGRLEIRLLPTDGATTYMPSSRRGQAILIAAGGSAANLVAAALAATVLSNVLAPATLSFVAIHVLFGVTNLIPHNTKVNATGTDGMKILRSLRRSQPTLLSTGPVAEARKVRRIAAALAAQGRPLEARELLDGRS